MGGEARSGAKPDDLIQWIKSSAERRSVSDGRRLTHDPLDASTKPPDLSAP